MKKRQEKKIVLQVEMDLYSHKIKQLIKKYYAFNNC